MPTTPALAVESVHPDEARWTAEFIAFLTEATLRRHPTGVLPRFNQGRPNGCVDAEFIVPDGLAPDLRLGLFAEPRRFAARIRFANASSTSDRDRDIRGMSFRVFDVGGENLTAGATVQDFVLNSHPVMMAANQRQFLALLRATDAGGFAVARFFLTHPRAIRVALASRQHHTSPLEIPYWSATPYLFGHGRAVKYLVRPQVPRPTPLPRPLTDTYLRDAMAAHLRDKEAVFDVLAQFQADGQRMPIEDASVEWKEADAPFRVVARLRIPPQHLDDREREDFCEEVAFNPWHARAEHRPLGDMNRARREIYRAMAQLRSERRHAT